MKVNGQYDDLDTPPQIPLFTSVVKTASKLFEGCTYKCSNCCCGNDTGQSTPSTTTLSPSKRAQVSVQYLEHLEKLKKLHESGVLSFEEFNE
jgi:hypothetical protein